MGKVMRDEVVVIPLKPQQFDNIYNLLVLKKHFIIALLILKVV